MAIWGQAFIRLSYHRKVWWFCFCKWWWDKTLTKHEHTHKHNHPSANKQTLIQKIKQSFFTLLSLLYQLKNNQKLLFFLLDRNDVTSFVLKRLFKLIWLAWHWHRVKAFHRLLNIIFTFCLLLNAYFYFNTIRIQNERKRMNCAKVSINMISI